MAKKKKLLVGLLFDQTGSMARRKTEALDGVQEYIKTLKTDGKNIRFTQVWFNSDYPFQVIHNNVKMEKVEPPTAEEYQPASTTPLYDAMGGMIRHMSEKMQVVKGKWHPVIVVMTDGLENASQEYDQGKIFKLVEEKKKDGWAFAFLGADIDSFAVGGAMGVAMASTLNYDKAKSRKAMHTTAEAILSYGRGETQSDKLFENVEEDDAVWRTA